MVSGPFVCLACAFHCLIVGELYGVAPEIERILAAVWQDRDPPFLADAVKPLTIQDVARPAVALNPAARAHAAARSRWLRCWTHPTKLPVGSLSVHCGVAWCSNGDQWPALASERARSICMGSPALS